MYFFFAITVMTIYNNFTELAAGTNSVSPDVLAKLNTQQAAPETVVDVATNNMTQVKPKVAVDDKQLQDKLKKHWIGCKGLEFEAPHASIRSPDNLKVRIRLRDGSLMDPPKVDKDVIKAVQSDIVNNPNKYFENWNLNNPDHKVLFEEQKQDEQPKKDESWKDAGWYKEQLQFYAPGEEGAGQNQPTE